MRWIRTIILTAGLTLFAGCSTPSAALGELTGGIYRCGGASDHGCPGAVTNGQSAQPIPGTVIVSASDRTVATIEVQEGQRYHVGLPSGTYTISAGSPFPTIQVVVKAGSTTTANLVDQIP